MPSPLIWKDYPAWSATLREVLGDSLSSQSIDRIRAMHPRHDDMEDIHWVEFASARCGATFSQGLVRTLASRLPQVFSAIRAYHACRPTNVNSYYQRGLLPMDLGQFEQQARDLFLIKDFPEVTSDVLDEIFSKKETVGVRVGRSFCVIDDRIFEDQPCQHYLRYGSEFLQGIAAQLQSRIGNGKHFESLARIGTPTIFTIDFPWQSIRDGNLQRLTLELLRLLFYDDFEKSPRSGFTLTAFEDIASSAILSHYHPQLDIQEG